MWSDSKDIMFAKNATHVGTETTAGNVENRLTVETQELLDVQNVVIGFVRVAILVYVKHS